MTRLCQISAFIQIVSNISRWPDCLKYFSLTRLCHVTFQPVTRLYQILVFDQIMSNINLWPYFVKYYSLTKLCQSLACDQIGEISICEKIVSNCQDCVKYLSLSATATVLGTLLLAVHSPDWVIIVLTLTFYSSGWKPYKN